MKNNLYWLLIAALLTGIGIISCNRNVVSDSENNIRWDSIHVEKMYHMQENPNNPNCNLQINFVFPVDFENKEVLEVVRQHITRSCFGELYENLAPAQAVEHYVEQYIDEYKKLEQDFLAEEEHDHEESTASWFSYYEYFFNEIVYNKNNLLCYAVYYENYTGGAHGSHSYTNHILDLNTGQVMTEKDFFVEGYQEELAAILVNKIAENNRTKDAKELESMGFFSIDEIYPNGNFSIDDTGLTYYFNEYEIAAYVIGATRVHLSYGEIKHLLSNDSRIASFTGRS
ncbi:MAG: DUF3298 and DUF4163 domain-containing protein [Tannerellaceae bacterium]|jgi:hypothetical protein|nr:DUF3298 and DUF4163 domain-containing protein [Tannerellaceae bacterium]